MAGRWIHAVAGGDCEVDVCKGGGGGSGSWTRSHRSRDVSYSTSIMYPSAPPICASCLSHLGDSLWDGTATGNMPSLGCTFNMKSRCC